jgi:hypothetical protein
MRDDPQETNRVFGVPRVPGTRRQGEEPQRVMGMPTDWFSSADPRITSLTHPIRTYRQWRQQRSRSTGASGEDSAE